MRVFSARRLIPACALSAVTAAVLIAPGVASAIDLGKRCTGSNIEAQGSSLQHIAQEVWGVPGNGFNKTFTFENEVTKTLEEGNTIGCSKAPTVTYHSTGSGAGLKAFGAEGVAPNYEKNLFAGTDEAPNETQKGEIESHAEGAEAKSLETVPILQGAVAVVVRLPEGCLVNNEVEGFKGRLLLKAKTLDEIYLGKKSKWSEITDNGDHLYAEKGKTCNAATSITRVVRADHSGTTHIIKEFLAEANLNTTEEEQKFTAEAYNEVEVEGKKEQPCKAALPEEEETWGQVAVGCENQRWPAAASIVRPFKKTGPAVAEKVAETPSSIGYAGLAEARSVGSFSNTGVGGSYKNKFWAPIQNNFNPEKPAEPATYADPASNNDVEAKGNANCSGTSYTDGKEKFPPESTRVTWAAARAKVSQTHYAICGLTYDLALRQYGKYTKGLETGSLPATKAQATTAENYLLYAVRGYQSKNAKAEVTGEGGGFQIKNHDFLALPTEILKKSETGIKEIGLNVG